jgi:Spy/CpxP family protein refolding chaperone
MTGMKKRLAVGAGAVALAIGLVGAGFAGAQQISAAQGPGVGAPAQRGGGPFGPGRGGRGMGMGGPGRAMGPGGLLGPAFRQLDLTDAQKDSVKGIVESHREEMRTLGQRAMNARQALDAAISADVFDEATVRTTAAEVAAVDADLAVMRAKVYSEVYQLLTPEQQSKLKEARRTRAPRIG